MKKCQFVNLILIVFSFCAAIALCMKFPSQLSPKYWGMANIIYEFRLCMDGSMVLTSGLVPCLFLAGKKTYDHWKHSIATAVLSVGIALLWLLSVSVDKTGSLEALSSTPAQVIKSAIYLFGMSYFLFLLGQILYSFCTRKADGAEAVQSDVSAIVRWYRHHTFFCNMALLMLAWTPYLILDYPARISWDSWRQMNMYFGYEPFTAHHPPAHTVLISMFVLLGKALGDANIGFLIFIILQMLMFASLIAYEVELMKDWGTPGWMRGATMLAAMTSTLYAYYSVDILKDCQYAHFFLLMMLEFALLLKKGRLYFQSKAHPAFMVTAICGVILFRKNGKYIVYLMLLAALVWLILRLIRNGMRYAKDVGVKPLAVLLVPVILAELISSGLTSHYNIAEASMRELFSLPFQQTARYVIEHPEEVTPEEAETIRAVINYDKLPDLYKPTISDPVKNTFKKDVSLSDLLAYFKTWFQHLVRQPMTYVEATIHQTYPLYYPFKESIRARYAVRLIPDFEEVITEVGYLTETIVPDGNEIAQHLGVTTYRIPVVGLLSSQAFYAVLLIYLAMYGILDRRTKFLWLVAPLILSILVVFVSPVILNHERYAFPFVYSTPIVLAFFYNSYRKKNHPEEIQKI